MRSTSLRASDSHVDCARIVLVCSVALLTALASWKASAAGAGEVHIVVMERMTFSPATVRVKPGERVCFKNADIVPHTATSKGKALFDSGMIKPGESWTFLPPVGRTIPFVCTYHPMMEGQIIAEKRR